MTHRPLVTLANSYLEGNVVRVTGTFTDATGAAADPTTVTVRYFIDPSGAVTTLVYVTDPEVVKDSTGVYHVDIAVSAPGKYRYGFAGTGAVGTLIANQEAYFVVAPSDLL